MAEQYAETEFTSEEEEVTQSDKELVSFIVDHCDKWRDWRDTNYEEKWDEYERIYYGVWSAEDRTRDSERSKIISPATRQAVDNRVAETMEGFAGSGKLFEVTDDGLDQDRTDVEMMQALLLEDTHNNAYINNVSSIVKLAEIYGTGIGEVLVKTEMERIPTTQPMLGEGMAAVGVTEQEKVTVKVKPVNPRNLLIDPNADAIDDSMGVAVEEYVSMYQIVQGIESGVYRKVNIEPHYEGDDLDPSHIEATTYEDDKVKIIRYYGLVPQEYLEEIEEDEEVVDLFPDESSADRLSGLVEAIVVIANDGTLLKAEKSPYMMEDRPIIAYRPEVRPGLFYGVGTVEKGYNMQKAIDAQLRSHMDSLALTTAPMMGIDATRLPRGMKFEVRPGKNILTNGNPAEILQPFKFGSTDASNYETAKGFEAMLLQATGTLDSAELVKSAAGGGGQNNGMGMSLAMSAIVKKNRVAMASFQDDFIIPMVKKVAYRYMQFDPDRYPMQDFKFTTLSSIGAITKEHEQQQLIGLMQTLGPNSPIVPILLRSIIATSGLLNKEQLMVQLDEMSQPDPQAQEMQQQQAQLQMGLVQAQANELNARAQESAADAQEAQARAQKLTIEASLLDEKIKSDIIRNLSANISSSSDDQEFEKRARIADLMLKEKDIDTKERIVDKQMAEKRMQQ